MSKKTIAIGIVVIIAAAVALIILFWPRETQHNETIPVEEDIEGSVEVEYHEGEDQEESSDREPNKGESEEGDQTPDQGEIDKSEMKL